VKINGKSFVLYTTLILLVAAVAGNAYIQSKSMIPAVGATTSGISPPPPPASGYSWSDSGTALQYMGINEVGTVVGLYAPNSVTVDESTPAYFYLTRDASSGSSVQSISLGFSLTICGGIGFEYPSCTLNAHLGFGLNEWDTWTWHIPIYSFTGLALTSESASAEDYTVDVSYPDVSYATMADIPSGEWDGPYTLLMTVKQKEPTSGSTVTVTKTVGGVTATATQTKTVTATATQTKTVTATSIPPTTVTKTVTATKTVGGAGETVTKTVTAAGSTATVTATKTVSGPTVTKTVAKPTVTVTQTKTVTATAIPTATPQSTATVYIERQSQSASPGNYFNIILKVEPGGRGVSSGEIHLSFDSTVMEIVDVEVGDLLGSNPLMGMKQIDNAAGTFGYALARSGSTPTTTPTGSFATVKLMAKSDAAPGRYTLTVTEASLADESFKDITGIRLQSGTVIVKAIPSDINGDSKVDYKDLAMLGASYGKSQGEFGFDSSTDLNNDGVVDYKDLAILGSIYGKAG